MAGERDVTRRRANGPFSSAGLQSRAPPADGPSVALLLRPSDDEKGPRRPRRSVGGQERYARQDVLAGLLVMAVALGAILWWPSTGGGGQARASSRATPMPCSDDPGIRIAVVPIDAPTSNARIEITSDTEQPVTVKELFMRSPAAFKGSSIDGVLVPPAPAVASRGRPYSWEANLGGPVQGTVVGIYRPPWGNNAVRATWDGPGGVTCDEYR